MKKNLIFLTILVLISFLLPINAFAEDKIETYFINSNKIQMTSVEYNNLLSMGFSHSEINGMCIDEFNSNKNLQGTIIAQTIQYYKTSIFYPRNNTIHTLSLSNPIITTEQISEQEYYSNSLSNQSSYYIINGQSGFVQTEYKLHMVTIIKNGDRYRYKSDLRWKKLPFTRSNDIQSIGIDPTVSIVPNSVNFYQMWEIENTDTGSCTYQYNYQHNWNVSSNGGIATFELMSNPSTSYDYSLSSHLYFDVVKLTSSTINVLNAYGDYAHAQYSVSLSPSIGISIDTSGNITFNVGVSPSIVNAYDSMDTSHAFSDNINW